jgi:membrane protease YdiL (CAAX protease family)
MKKPYIVLWLVSIVATAAGIPYAFELQKDVIAQVPIALPIFILITIIQTAILLAIAVFFGAKLARAIGVCVFALFPADSVDGHVFGVRGILKYGIPTGVIAAVAIYIADRIFLVFFTPTLSVTTTHVAVWKTLLASLYGGVVEEVLLRLFVLSFVAWILAKLTGRAKPSENGILMWSAIVISSILFGLGHLPATASLAVITPAVVVRAIVLNGIGGLLFGWLFWKRGLETGIVAHFFADIVLLVLLPVFLA